MLHRRMRYGCYYFFLWSIIIGTIVIRHVPCVVCDVIIVISYLCFCSSRVSVAVCICLCGCGCGCQHRLLSNCYVLNYCCRSDSNDGSNGNGSKRTRHYRRRRNFTTNRVRRATSINNCTIIF